MQVARTEIAPPVTPDRLPVTMDVGIYNPSDTAIELGDVTFAVVLTECPAPHGEPEARPFGQVTVPRLSLSR